MTNRDTIGSRLQRATAARGWSTRQFHRELQERLGEDYSSYAAVYRYLSGENTPSVDFLKDAAAVLGVRKEWLAFGEGAMTQEMEEVETGAALAEDYLAKLLEERVPQLVVGEHVMGLAKHLLLRVYGAQFYLARSSGTEPPSEVTAADYLAGFLTGPLQEFRIRNAPAARVGGYAVGMLNALSLLLPDQDDVRTDFD